MVLDKPHNGQQLTVFTRDSSAYVLSPVRLSVCHTGVS